MPGGRDYLLVPANLGIVMGVWIYNARGEGKTVGGDYAATAE